MYGIGHNKAMVSSDGKRLVSPIDKHATPEKFTNALPTFSKGIRSYLGVVIIVIFYLIII